MNNECTRCESGTERSYIDGGYEYIICNKCGKLKEKWRV